MEENLTLMDQLHVADECRRLRERGGRRWLGQRRCAAELEGEHATAIDRGSAFT
jgi:hypothetical protein